MSAGVCRPSPPWRCSSFYQAKKVWQYRRRNRKGHRRLDGFVGLRGACQESDALHAAWTIPGAGRPSFQAAGANFSRHSPAKVDTHKADRGPLLLTSGTDDHTVPLKVTKEVVAMYSHSKAQTDFHTFEGRGHSLTIDSRWKDVADVALKWLAANGLYAEQNATRGCAQ
jgi:pimeloyl-ACP methyl ester carboxylesterase